jgi:very-short-patch-repair endonuclease/DNA polymerase III delta prime subunit
MNSVETDKPTEDPVKLKLDEARRELLDLSLRNNLLNYRALKTKGAVIVGESPVEIMRILVGEGRTMSFLPAREGESEDQQALFPENGSGLDQRWGQPEEGDDAIALRLTDTKLQTPYVSQVLQKRLLNTYYAARTYVEEQGVSTLFLALGMLHWYEAASSEQMHSAPLILIPVELSRSNVQSRFRLQHSEDEIVENLSLRYKLQSDFGIRLSDFPEDDEFDVSSYFRTVSDSIAGYARWGVDGDAVALGFFSFGKFLMFNDLDSDQWSQTSRPEANPVLRGLLQDGFEELTSELDENAGIDDLAAADDVLQVVDADSSQTLAMLKVRSGHHLIIQGPPGTGKSQTITNLIAEAVAHGKTVLFVSEKMAALEVVKRRLDRVGLGNACLELHSQKTKKRIVLDELRRCLDLGQPRAGVEVDKAELGRHRESLNCYCQAVNTEIGQSRLTPYQVYGHLVHTRDILSGKQLPKLDIQAPERWTSEQARRNLSLADEVEHFIQKKVGRPADHPFWGSQLVRLLPTESDRIRALLSKTRQSLDELQDKARAVSQLLCLTEAVSITEIKKLLEISQFVLTAPDLRQVKVDSKAWLDRATDIAKMLEAGYRITSLHGTFDGVLRQESWDADVEQLRSLLARYEGRWWRALSGDYREAQRRLASLFVARPPKPLDSQLQILDAILVVKGLSSVVQAFDETAHDLYGARWRGLQSNWQELGEISRWVATLHRNIRQRQLPSEILSFVATSQDSSILAQGTDELQRALTAYETDCRQVVDSLELDESVRFGNDKALIDLPLSDQESHLTVWFRELDRLQDIIVLGGLCRRLEENGLRSLVDAACSWPLAHRHLVDLLQHTWLTALLERAWVERPILAHFDGAVHERSMRKFCELDTRLLRQNRIRLAYQHWKTLPKHEAGGQLGVLHHEFSKKRRHRPIRRLIQEAGRVIQAIKPVFMMSPLSIATFLPPGSIAFDMVVFDEASQVKPVDAFGAVLRGAQLVVVGDEYQLPPTVFFESEGDVDEDYSESITSDLGSILGLCYTRGIPQTMLRWHYRSQHESLIAVSNYEFYDNKLVVFPSPDRSKREVGLFYHYLPDTEYDRGKSRRNPKEARAVAQAMMRHAKVCPELTLGVAAFSISQTQAIRDQLEVLRRQDPSCEEFFMARHPHEPYFVKNLENVQGDERDVIFISVGYGRTPDGRVSMHFGPLNHEGGERRLNVLITRARRRCEVFTNLSSDDIDLSKTAARGVHVLKRFLQYAETGHLEMAQPSGREAESAFEEAVADSLRKLGYRVEHQVGSGGFFVDLAIIDEDRPGRYLLGIECDGATYHSARSARDRDRLRQEVLEKLGWRIHRIWSTDWFRNPGQEMRRLLLSIDEAKAHYASRGQSDPRSTHECVEEAPAVERNEPASQRRLAFETEAYITAKLSIASYRATLHLVSLHRMPEWIRQVVEIESPVHKDEVARRIANCAGVRRVGRRIRVAFAQALSVAARDGLVTQKGEFLWRPDMKAPKLRSRSQLPASSRHVSLISPEEIRLAILEVVRASYGISRDDIPEEVCKLFGFKRTTRDMRAPVDQAVDKLLADGGVVEDGGYVSLP